MHINETEMEGTEGRGVSPDLVDNGADSKGSKTTMSHQRLDPTNNISLCENPLASSSGKELNDDDDDDCECSTIPNDDDEMSPETSILTQRCNLVGIYVWYSDIDKIEGPSAGPRSTWFDYIKLVSPKDRERILKFHFEDDKKRALLSVLLQRACVRAHLSVNSDEDFVIERTKENKPYAKCSSRDLGSWNYNVSHHGRYVCIVSHPSLIVGADLVDLETRSPSIKSTVEYFNMFDSQLHPKELAAIFSQPTETAQYNHFFVTWSLKEAFVKAIGLGLGFNLLDIIFTILYSEEYVKGGGLVSGTAMANILGEIRNDWKFEFFSLDERHVMSIARGPIRDVITSYSKNAWPKLAHVDSKGDDATTIKASKQQPLSPQGGGVIHGYSSPVNKSIVTSLENTRAVIHTASSKDGVIAATDVNAGSSSHCNSPSSNRRSKDREDLDDSENSMSSCFDSPDRKSSDAKRSNDTISTPKRVDKIPVDSLGSPLPKPREVSIHQLTPPNSPLIRFPSFKASSSSSSSSSSPSRDTTKSPVRPFNVPSTCGKDNSVCTTTSQTSKDAIPLTGLEAANDVKASPCILSTTSSSSSSSLLYDNPHHDMDFADGKGRRGVTNQALPLAEMNMNPPPSKPSMCHAL